MLRRVDGCNVPERAQHDRLLVHHVRGEVEGVYTNEHLSDSDGYSLVCVASVIWHFQIAVGFRFQDPIDGIGSRISKIQEFHFLYGAATVLDARHER